MRRLEESRAEETRKTLILATLLFLSLSRSAFIIALVAVIVVRRGCLNPSMHIAVD
jgi:hypothetical protein